MRISKVIRLAVFVIAQALIVAQLYAAEHKPRLGLAEVTRTYVDRSYGFAIDLPKDFRLSSEQGDVLFFQSHERAGTVIIRPRPGLTVSNIQSALRNGFDNEGIQIETFGSPETLEFNSGQGLRMESKGTVNGREVHGVIAGIIGGDNQGYMILIGSVRERWMGFESTALASLDSFTFTRVQPGFESERWEQRLKGTQLVFSNSRGNFIQGGAVAGGYHFCSDGHYLRRFDRISTETDGWSRYSQSSTDKGKGTWQVQLEDGIPRLYLTPKRGALEVLPLKYQAGEIVLGGVPYKFAVNKVCK